MNFFGSRNLFLTAVPVCCLLTFGATSVRCQEESSAPASVEASVDKTQITIGDQVQYKLSIEYDNGVEVQKPGWGEGLSGFQILDFEQGERMKVGNRWKVEDTYTLSTFTPEDYVIPPLAVPITLPTGATQVLETQPISISVASVLPEDEETLSLRTLKDPVPVYSGILTGRVVMAALAALGILLLIYLVWRYKHREELPLPVVPPRPEDEVALEALARLRAEVSRWKDPLPQQQCKSFGLELSEVLRGYLERRYGFIALEMTTEEIRRHLETSPLAASSLIQATPAVSLNELAFNALDRTDLLKFAKFVQPIATLESLLDGVERVVEETRRPREIWEGESGVGPAPSRREEAA